MRSPSIRCRGYARVSTYGQTLDAQLDQLHTQGCVLIGVPVAEEPKLRFGSIHPVSTAALIRRPGVSGRLGPASSTAAVH